jgi:nucleoside-diphosphate-sugar epimerase
MEKISLDHKSILVTGGAGFIGSNLIKRLFTDTKGTTIVNIDNMNDYYDVSLKEYRLAEIAEIAEKLGHTDNTDGTDFLSPAESADIAESKKNTNKYVFVKGDIADKETVNRLFEKYHFDVVVNLAAQAGVRYSIENPDAYIQSNMIGFYNILEACRHSQSAIDNGQFSHGECGVAKTIDNYKGVQHLVYASSSSVYGGNKKVPFSTDDRVDNPVSLYAATKKSNELFAHCYSKLYNIPTTGLRFFTVYGPAGRPDMAYFGFTNKLQAGKTIQIFNYGNCRRDFTYVDDIVEGIVRVMQGAPSRQVGEDGLPVPPYAVYNIGGGQPENLLDFVQILQEELVRAGVLPKDYDFETHKELVPMQPGDVPTTYADATALERDFGFTPKITLREGLRKFAEWHKAYYC